MKGVTTSRATAALMRALLGRSGAARETVLVTQIQSREWRSLTFAGERHLMSFRILPPHADVVARRMVHQIEDAEFSIPGILVADIAVEQDIDLTDDGAATVTIAALTIDEA